MEFSGVFLVKKSEVMRRRRDNVEVLRMELRDAHGSFIGYINERPREWHAQIVAGNTLLEVVGQTTRNRDPIMAGLRSARIHDGSGIRVEDIVPTTGRDPQVVRGEIVRLREAHVRGADLLLVQKVHADEGLRAAFQTSPFGRDGSLARVGGVSVGTMHAMTLAAAACQLSSRLDASLMVASAELVFIGMCDAVKLAATIEETEDGEDLGYVDPGMDRVKAAAIALGEAAPSWERVRRILHCMRMQEGPSATRRFNSREAKVLWRIVGLAKCIG